MSFYKLSILRSFLSTRNVLSLMVALVFALSLTACGDSSNTPSSSKGEVNEVAKYGAARGGSGEIDKSSYGGKSKPEGHGTMNDTAAFGSDMPVQKHTNLKSTKEVRVSDEVKAKWKSVRLSVSDNSTGSKEVMTVDVGAKTELKGGFSLRVEAFLPDYGIYDNYISSRTNEPLNPAVLVELHSGDEIVASGWIFEELTQYNSYSHLRYAVVLLPAAK